jgi:hypothetical protein
MVVVLLYVIFPGRVLFIAIAHPLSFGLGMR